MRKLAVFMGLILAGVASANLVTDGDFEAADASAWTYVSAGWGANYDATTEKTPGNPGEAGYLGWTEGGSGSQAYLQSFVAPTAAIDFSWDWQTIPANGTGGANGWYEAGILPGSVADIGGLWDDGGWVGANAVSFTKEEYGFGNPLPPPHGAWQSFSDNGIAVTAGATYTVMLKGGGSPATANQSWFDNVTVVPEPGTVLLGLGGLALLIRRRR